MKKLPCGMSWRLPNFCKGRSCSTCVLNDKAINEEAVAYVTKVRAQIAAVMQVPPDIIWPSEAPDETKEEKTCRQ